MIQKVERFGNVVFIWVVFDQRRWGVVVEFSNSKICKNSKCENVPLNKKCQLWMSIAFDLKRIWHGDLYKKCSPWCGLGWGAKSWQSLVWKFWIARAQSSDQTIIGRFDQYHMWAQFVFENHLICDSLIPKVVISV